MPIVKGTFNELFKPGFKIQWDEIKEDLDEILKKKCNGCGASDWKFDGSLIVCSYCNSHHSK